MAKKSAAGYIESNETAQAQLAPRNEAEELAEVFDFEFDSDGLEEVDSEDLRFAVKVWNMRSKKPDSDDFFRVDEFFDTLTEKTSRQLDCALVHLHKTNDYSYYDKDKDETVRVCSSYDRITGRLRVVHPETNQPEGTERNCENCPDAQWRRNEKGKNTRNCGPVYGVFCVELDERGDFVAPFLIRFKRTSLNPFRTYMQKHHLGRMKDKAGRPANVPLFAYKVAIKLQADEKGQFAVPVLERGDRFAREVLMELAQQAKHFRDMASDVTRAAEKKESQYQTDAVETTGEPLRNDDFNDLAD